MNPIAAAASAKNRKRKYDLFMKTVKPSGSDRILDVGFTNREYSSCDNYLERHYPHPANITALGIGGEDLFRQAYPQVKTVLYDGGVFPFDDHSFEIGWSNAVLEHVGDENAQVFFLKEMNRVCQKLYFTTPNRFFPFCVHTKLPLVHWLPTRHALRDRIFQWYGRGWAGGNYMYLLSCSQLKRILTLAGITNYVIHRNRFLGWTMDFSVIKTI